MYLFSPTTFGFYPSEMRDEYQEYGSIPDDVIEVSDETRDEYNFAPPEGKQLGVKNGLPAWVEPAPLTKKELVDAAEEQKQILISLANDYINSRQWPGKAAIGRLKGEDLAQYNLWLDYLDALEAVDTFSAPNINWPTPPGGQAN